VGLARNDDFNGVSQDGAGFYQSTQRGGRRWSTAAGYLRPAMRRQNLSVETDALVVKVLIEDGRAVGVRYVRHGAEHEARATYLADAADMELLAAGVRRAREIAAQEPLPFLLARESSPGEDVRADEQLRTWVPGNVTTIFHPTASCAMGGDEQAVCDPQLRVRGLEGLRVVDVTQAAG
jgi:choline dehydrogenase-like flavoprotein